MNKNIFFISIIMLFSAFNAVQASAIKPKAVQHEPIKGMQSIEQLRRLHRDRKEATRVADAMSAAGLPAEELSPLSSEQQNYVRGLFDQYGVPLSSSLFDRMRCAKQGSASIGALTDKGIHVFPPQMLAPKNSMPVDLQEDYAQPSIQAWSLFFDRELYNNRSRYDSIEPIETVSTAEARALAKMKCPSCMHEVSRFFRGLGQNDHLIAAGQRIHDPKHINRIIGDLGHKAAPCKSCRAGIDNPGIGEPEGF